MENEILLVEELENILIAEGVRYNHEFTENWETVKFDPTYFDAFISGPLYAEFIAAIYERIKPLNNHEIGKFLNLSVAQFKTHTPEKRERAFILNYWRTFWHPNRIDDKVNEYEEKYAKHILKHYTTHFHLFKEATERALSDFKRGLIGYTELKPTPKNEIKVQDFFDKVKEGEISQLEIYNQVQKFTDNFELKKLEILLEDFEFYFFMERDKKQGEYTDEEIATAIQEHQDAGKPLPYIKTPVFKGSKIKNSNPQEDKVIDLEKLINPYDFFLCYQFKNFLKYEIESRKGKSTNHSPSLVKKEVAISNNTQRTFDNTLSKENAEFLLKMLEDMSITIGGKSILSERKKGAVRGVVEATREKNILP